MWDHYLRRTSITKHRIEFAPGQENPMHCAPYCVKPKARECEKSETDKTLEMKVLGTAEAEWGDPIIVPRKEGSIKYFVDYWKQNDVTGSDAYFIFRLSD